MKKNLLKSMIVAMAVVLCNLSAMAYDFYRVAFLTTLLMKQTKLSK